MYFHVMSYVFGEPRLPLVILIKILNNASSFYLHFYLINFVFIGKTNMGGNRVNKTNEHILKYIYDRISFNFLNKNKK